MPSVRPLRPRARVTLLYSFLFQTPLRRFYEIVLTAHGIDGRRFDFLQEDGYYETLMHKLGFGEIEGRVSLSHDGDLIEAAANLFGMIRLLDEELIPLAEVERIHLLHVLDASRNNKSKAARILGISRQTLREKLKGYQATDASLADDAAPREMEAEG